MEPAQRKKEGMSPSSVPKVATDQKKRRAYMLKEQKRDPRTIET